MNVSAVVSAAVAASLLIAGAGGASAQSRSIPGNGALPTASDTPREAYEKAEACIQLQAQEFASAAEPASVVVDAVLGGCIVLLDHAMATTRQHMALGQIATPPPEGFFLDVPPCKGGAVECPPWDRDWSASGAPPAVGSVFGSTDTATLQSASDMAALRIERALKLRATYWVLSSRAAVR